jgi:hypothetical protein
MSWWPLWMCGAFLLGVVAGSITMSLSVKGHAEQEAHMRATILHDALMRERIYELVAYIEDMYHEGRAEEAFKKIKQAKEGHYNGTY